MHFSHSLFCPTVYAHRSTMDTTASVTSSAASSVDGRSGGGSSDYLNLGMFSTVGGTQQLTQQSSDLLGSGGSLSIGNGFGNESGGGVNAASGAPLDLRDFPSLVGGPGNGLAMQQHQQHLLATQQMLQVPGSKATTLYSQRMAGTNGNFTMASEDFPALSGAPRPSAVGSNGSGLGASSLLGSNGAPVSRTSSSGGSLYGSELVDGSNQLEGAAGLLGGAGLGSLSGLRGLHHPQQGNSNPSLSRAPSSSAPSSGAVGSSSAPGGGTGSSAGSALTGDYGLLGLLGVIRMTDADRNALALGSDLAMLGLNLGSPEQIYSTFGGPWTDGAVSKEPHYQVCFEEVQGKRFPVHL